MIGMFSAEWQLSNLSLHVPQIKKRKKEKRKSPVSKDCDCQASKHKETTNHLDSRDKQNNYLMAISSLLTEI